VAPPFFVLPPLLYAWPPPVVAALPAIAPPPIASGRPPIAGAPKHPVSPPAARAPTHRAAPPVAALPPPGPLIGAAVPPPIVLLPPPAVVAAIAAPPLFFAPGGFAQVIAPPTLAFARIGPRFFARGFITGRFARDRDDAAAVRGGGRAVRPAAARIAAGGARPAEARTGAAAHARPGPAFAEPHRREARAGRGFAGWHAPWRGPGPPGWRMAQRGSGGWHGRWWR
jgi:hypothetical protein